MSLAAKTLYLEVKDKILAIDEINHFDYWNEEFINESDTTPFPKPAVFFELDGIAWETQRTRRGSIKDGSDKIPLQYGECTFTLHCLVRKIDGDLDQTEILHFDYLTSIYEVIHTLSIPNVTSSRVQRLNTNATAPHKAIRDFSETYSFRIIECPTTNIGDSLTEVTPWDSNITGESIIKPHL